MAPWKAVDYRRQPRKVNILLPATKGNVNLCKTLLTMTLLGYPNPHIVAWEEDEKGGNLLGGGSHFAKITRTLDWINDSERRKQPGFDNELVFMLDSYDIWFQLPLQVLLARYEAIVADENARVAHRMGRAHALEHISSPIVFGGGKRCAPNELHTMACFPVPETPLPDDTHGGNTDTLIGRNQWTSFRTRYLNSGYLIGPVSKIRPMLERAKQKLSECAERKDAPFDDGSGASNNCYRGSDQSIFVEMFGEQEFHREVMRRHHRTSLDNWLDTVISDRAGSRPPPIDIQGAPILDRLEPAFPHQKSSKAYVPNKPFEFGIAIDYWSLLGHQTANAEDDYRFIRHNETLEPQVGRQGIFDCRPKAPMPKDLHTKPLKSLVPTEPNRWDTMPLYTEICVGSVPVMIHHNSPDKSHRERQWDRTWWHGRSRALLEDRRRAGAPMLKDGIPTDNGTMVQWEELCPFDVEPELFRDVKAKEKEKEKGKE